MSDRPPSKRDSGSGGGGVRRVRNSAGASDRGNTSRVSYKSPLGEFSFDVSKPNSKAKTGRVRIVVADKNAIIRAVFERHLGRHYDLVICSSATEALHAIDARDTLPDLIILGIDLADMPGEDVRLAFPSVPEERASAATVGVIRYYIPQTRIPIIVIGKHGSTTRLIQCMKNGAQDFIFKPPRGDELHAKIEMQLRLVDSIRLEAEGSILRRILPEYIIERLHGSTSGIADNHNALTFMFADLCNFTEMCGRTETGKVVSFLNELYTAFDQLVDRNGVYKVDIIGDAYMCVSGHEEQSRRFHASCMLNFALDMLTVASEMKLPAPRESLGPDGKSVVAEQLPVRLRIGIHSGPASAGVIGEKCPRYTFFGDTVNVASRMESHGAPMTVHLSQDCLTELLKEGWDETDFIFAGETSVKGKGLMNTFFVKAGEFERAVQTRQSRQSAAVKIRDAAGKLFRGSNPGKRPSIGSTADLRNLLGPEGIRERAENNAVAEAHAAGESGGVDMRRRSMGKRTTHDGVQRTKSMEMGQDSDEDDGDSMGAGAQGRAAKGGFTASGKRSTIDECGLAALRRVKTAPKGIIRARPASNPSLLLPGRGQLAALQTPTKAPAGALQQAQAPTGWAGATRAASGRPTGLPTASGSALPSSVSLGAPGSAARLDMQDPAAAIGTLWGGYEDRRFTQLSEDSVPESGESSSGNADADADARHAAPGGFPTTGPLPPKRGVAVVAAGEPDDIVLESHPIRDV